MGGRRPAASKIRVYPDVETFRNATGEPGWVAARTSGRRIQLQPAAVLRERGALDSTIHHELLHVFVEAQAAGGLPVWFREGLVGYLEHPVKSRRGRCGGQRPATAGRRRRRAPRLRRRGAKGGGPGAALRRPGRTGVAQERASCRNESQRSPAPASRSRPQRAGRPRSCAPRS